jgi:hypothetical protein
MRRSTLAILVLAGIAIAACAKRQSLYLDSGRGEGATPPNPQTQKAFPAQATSKAPGPAETPSKPGV